MKIGNWKLKIVAVIFIIGGFIALLNTSLFSTGTASAAWYSTGGVWTYRKQIAVDNNKVPSAQNNFPMLVSVTDSDLKFTDFGGNVASSTGGDILFTNADGTTMLNYEIEKYASTTGELIAWVQVPFLSSTSTTNLYMYYGNVSAPPPAASVAQNVWDSNYKAVYHFGDGTTLDLNDSTSNNNDGTAYGGAHATTTAAKIGGGIGFDGNGDYVRISHSDSLNIAGSLTLSVWAKFSYDTVATRMLITKPAGANGGYSLNHDSVWFGMTTWKDWGWNNDFIHKNNATMDSTRHLAGRWNAEDDPDTAMIFVDGVSQSANMNYTSSPPAMPVAVVSDLYLGQDSASDRYYNGTLDELRISATPRSDDWIATEYNNQSSPSTFYRYGGGEQENRAAGTAGVKISSSAAVAGAPGWFSTGGTWSYRKKIEINYQKVATTTGPNIINFPMLVSVTDSDLKFTGSGGKVASSTAGDIVFTSGNGTTALNYEIEKYVSTTGELVAWVQIPFLSSTSTTPIYMYLGNASAPNVAASTWQNTWDSNYEGVWHLPNGTTLTALDSTSGANNGTISGPTATSGKFDGGGNWNGGSDYIDAGSGMTLDSNNWTISTWIYMSNVATSYTRFLSYYGNGPTIWKNGGSGAISLVHAGTIDLDCSLTLTNSGWYQVTITRAGSTATCYSNGSQTAHNASFSATFTNDTSVRIGNSTAYNEPPTGILDEVRISSIARSTDWIKTEYNNQSSPSSFYTYGGLETQSSRVNSAGASMPAVKIRGGVKFR